MAVPHGLCARSLLDAVPQPRARPAAVVQIAGQIRYGGIRRSRASPPLCDGTHPHCTFQTYHSPSKTLYIIDPLLQNWSVKSCSSLVGSRPMLQTISHDQYVNFCSSSHFVAHVQMKGKSIVQSVMVSSHYRIVFQASIR